MKLLTFYSKSHEELYNEFFLKSYNKYLLSELKLDSLNIDQLSIDGSFGSEGFEETMLLKMKHIISNIDFKDEFLIYADCDIQFFEPIKEDLIKELGSHDIKFQDDITCLCAGFFICRQTPLVKSFFEKVLETLENNMINGKLRNGISDQKIINHIKNSFNDIKIGKLPSSKYFTIASINTKQWIGEEYNIPQTIKIHHGNWTVGLENKTKLMEYVRANRK